MLTIIFFSTTASDVLLHATSSPEDGPPVKISAGKLYSTYSTHLSKDVLQAYGTRVVLTEWRYHGESFGSSELTLRWNSKFVYWVTPVPISGY
jgi:hypothetical protein